MRRTTRQRLAARERNRTLQLIRERIRHGWILLSPDDAERLDRARERGLL